MNNQNKIILGVAISYFVVVAFTALKITQSTQSTQPTTEDDEIKQEQKKE